MRHVRLRQILLRCNSARWAELEASRVGEKPSFPNPQAILVLKTRLRYAPILSFSNAGSLAMLLAMRLASSFTQAGGTGDKLCLIALMLLIMFLDLGVEPL